MWILIIIHKRVILRMQEKDLGSDLKKENS